MVTFLLFANMRERAGVSCVELPRLAEQSTVLDAWHAVCAAHPDLAAWTGRVAFARNGEYVPSDTPVTDGDELAAIPPVSGG